MPTEDRARCDDRGDLTEDLSAEWLAEFCELSTFVVVQPNAAFDLALENLVLSL